MGNVDAWDKLFEPIAEVICKNILRQKQRLGGNFAVAQATPTKFQRDIIRKYLGPSVIFVVLSLSGECQEKRLKARHTLEEDQDAVKFLSKIFGFYEQPSEDEHDAIHVLISDDMNPQDVVNHVLRKINQI